MNETTNETMMLDYIIKHLEEIKRGSATASALIAELTAARKSIAVVPNYVVKDVVTALFGGAENAE